jgi:Zn-dependent metalloprotease
MRSHCRNPIHCFVPPYVLSRLAATADEPERIRALATLTRDSSIRTARLQNAKQRARGPREGADFLATVAPPGPHRIIRDAQHREEVSVGPIVRREGDPATGEKQVDEAYDGLGATYRFFAEVFGRNSIDDEGMPLRGVVHYGREYDNAFWDGRRMVFGDGDGEFFTRFTRDLDVIGHELGHGVTEDEIGLEYFGQSGALNESLSDVWGSLVQQYKQGQSAGEANWLIGDKLIKDKKAFGGKALRSMAAPGTAFDGDPQPAHWRDYVRTIDDNGGVHINSGIPNHAFYVVATTLSGNAWERAGWIWYDATLDPKLKPTATFRQFARITLQAAQRRFGATGGEVDAVRAGWEKVGITL